MKRQIKFLSILFMLSALCGCTESTPEGAPLVESTSVTEAVGKAEKSERSFYAEYFGKEIEFSEGEIETLKKLTEESICKDNYCYNFTEMLYSEIEALGKLGFMCELSLSDGEKANIAVNSTGTYIIKNGERYWLSTELGLFFLTNLEKKITDETNPKDILSEEAFFIYTSNYTAPSNELMKYKLSDERADGIKAILSANMDKLCDIEVDDSFEIHPVEFRFYFDHLFEGEYHYINLISRKNNYYFSYTTSDNVKYYEISEQVWTDLSCYLDNCAPKEVYGTITEIKDEYYIVVKLEDSEVESITANSSKTFSVGDRVRIRYSGYLHEDFHCIIVDYARSGDEDAGSVSQSELDSVKFEAKYDGEFLTLSEEEKREIYALAEESVASFLGNSALGLWGNEGYNVVKFCVQLEYEDGHMMYVEDSDSVREVTAVIFDVYSENTYIVCLYDDDMKVFELPERYAERIRAIAEKYMG